MGHRYYINFVEKSDWDVSKEPGYLIGKRVLDFDDEWELGKLFDRSDYEIKMRKILFSDKNDVHVMEEDVVITLSNEKIAKIIALYDEMIYKSLGQLSGIKDFFDEYLSDNVVPIVYGM